MWCHEDVLSLVAFAPAHFGLLQEWFTSEREVVQWGGAGLHHPLDDAQLQGIVDECRADPPARAAWTAVTGDEIVGHIELGYRRAEATARLGRVGIAPEQRGRGLGVELVSSALDAAWSLDWVTRADLRVYTFNTPALATYRRLGFETVDTGPEVRRVDGQTWEVSTMALDRPA